MFLKCSLLKYKQLSSSKPTCGTSVSTISNPKGFAWQDSQGKVTLHSPGLLHRLCAQSLKEVALQDLAPPTHTLGDPVSPRLYISEATSQLLSKTQSKHDKDAMEGSFFKFLVDISKTGRSRATSLKEF